MKSFPRQFSAVALATLLCAAALDATAAARLMLVHVAASARGDAAAEFAFDGAPVLAQLQRGTHTPYLSVDAGSRRLTVTAPEISVAPLALELIDGESYAVFLAGDGRRVPFELRYSRDHNRPFIGNAISFQSANLATLADGDTGPAALRMTQSCAPDGERGGSFDVIVRYGHGSGSEAVAETLALDHRRTATDGATQCKLTIAYADTPDRSLIERGYEALPGQRLRLVAFGDGNSVPLAVLLIEQARESTRAARGMDASLAGYWVSTRAPGEAISVRIGGPGWLAGAYMGYEPPGAARWASYTALPAVGGALSALAPELNVSVTIPVREPGSAAGSVRIEATASGQLTFLSCNEAVWSPSSGAPSALFSALPEPQHHVRLVRLTYPVACSDPT